MKFLIDACISNYAVKALRDSGYDVLWIPELGKEPSVSVFSSVTKPISDE